MLNSTSNDQSGTTYDPGTLSYDTKYYWKIVATDNHGASTSGPLWDFTTEQEQEYNVDLTVDSPGKITTPNVNATYVLTVTNTGIVMDSYTLSINNIDNVAIAILNISSVTNLPSGSSATVLLNVTDESSGTYNVSVTATSQGNTSISDTIITKTTVREILPPQIVTYTITNRTITPPQTTEIDVAFSEEVAWRIAIEGSSVIYDWIGTSTNPAPKTWDGTYEVNSTIVPDGDYYVNVSGTNITTGLSVVNNTEIIKVTSVPPTEIVINEFVSDNTTEWVELYNKGGDAVDLTGWTLEDEVGNSKSLTSLGTIEAYGYKVFTTSSWPFVWLNNDGDVIWLKNPTGETVDRVGYGTSGDAPAPEAGNSAGRYPNGIDTDDDAADFVEFGIPTPDAPNEIGPGSIFDTGVPSNSYPSISGTHNGIITPNADITVSKLYTYPCAGTGGHTEYAKIWNASWDGAEAHWNGYVEDWHNISFDKTFVLYANETYNYTIRTGSYPQIIHKTPFNATGGRITCDKFIDANGRVHYDWIPAVRLWAE